MNLVSFSLLAMAGTVSSEDYLNQMLKCSFVKIPKQEITWIGKHISYYHERSNDLFKDYNIVNNRLKYLLQEFHIDRRWEDFDLEGNESIVKAILDELVRVYEPDELPNCEIHDFRYTLGIIEYLFNSIRNFLKPSTSSVKKYDPYLRFKNYLKINLANKLKTCIPVVGYNYALYVKLNVIGAENSLDMLMSAASSMRGHSALRGWAFKKKSISLGIFSWTKTAMKKANICNGSEAIGIECLDTICLSLVKQLSNSIEPYEIVTTFEPAFINKFQKLDDRFYKLREYSRLCNGWLAERGIKKHVKSDLNRKVNNVMKKYNLIYF